jgi:hypothetical protein
MLRQHSGIPEYLGILLAVVLGLVLVQPGAGDALSIRAQLTSDFVRVPPTPGDPFGFTFPETLSCTPPGCSAFFPYSVKGTSSSTIPAQLHYSLGVLASRHTVVFHASDPNGRLLARLQSSGFSDFGGFEATSCGPQPGSCVSFRPSFGGHDSPLPGDFDPTFPRFPEVSAEEFFARGSGEFGFGGDSGFIPFYLPVGPKTGIGMNVDLAAGISFEPGFCLDDPSSCHSEVHAVFSVVPLLPPGASFLEPVPEPATLVLVGTTVVGLGLARWRQRRRKHQP